MNYSDKLALIREYKGQGGKGSYLSLLKSYERGGNLEDPPYRNFTAEADNTNYTQQGDQLERFAILKEQARREEEKRRMQPPVSLVPVAERYGKNIKDVGRMFLEAATPPVIAAAGAASMGMAAPVVASGLGSTTLPTALGTMAKGITGAVAMDYLYDKMGGKPVGEILDVQNPYLRFGLNMIGTPGVVAGMGTASSYADDLYRLGKKANSSSILEKINNVTFGYEKNYSKQLDELNKIYNKTSEIDNEVFRTHNRISKKLGTIRANLDSPNYPQLYRDKDYFEALLRKTKDLTLEENSIIQPVKGELSGAVNTRGSITDLLTGETYSPTLAVPEKKIKFSKVPGQSKGVTPEVQTSVDINSSVVRDPKYREILDRNIQYLEELSGGKAFGSSVSAKKIGLPHVIGDYDMLITREAYDKNIKGVYKATSDKSVATEHMIKGKYGEAPVDFAIVDSDGKYATGKIANQLFRQFDPDGYYQASKEAIKNNSDLKIPYSSKELLDLVDPVVKTVMDAYEAGYRNPKHIPKFDALLSYGDNIDDVLKAQEMYVKSVVGSKGKVAPNFMSSFNDLSNNAEILRLLEIPGNIKEIISDPKKMQAALNDWYINRSVLSRGVTKHSDMTFDDVLNSYTRWKKTQHYAGNAYGAGLNTVRHGMSGEYDIYGNMQQNLKYSEDNLFKFIQDVKKQVDGDIPFTPEEKIQVEDLLKKNGYNTSVRTPIDFIETLGDDVNSQALLNEFSSITGIRSVGGRSYSSNSIYASLTKEIDNELEKFAFAFTKDDAAVPKSLEMRKNYIRSNSDNTPLAVYNDVKEFEKLYSILKNNGETIQRRLNIINDQLQQAKNAVNKLDRDVQKHPSFLKLIEEKNKLMTMREDVLRQISKAEKINTIIKMAAPIGLVVAGAGIPLFILESKSGPMSKSRKLVSKKKSQFSKQNAYTEKKLLNTEKK